MSINKLLFRKNYEDTLHTHKKMNIILWAYLWTPDLAGEVEVV